MDATSILRGIVTLALLIKKKVDEVKTNRKKCETLCSRVQLLIPALEGKLICVFIYRVLELSKVGNKETIDLLHAFQNCVQKASDLISEFTDNNWLSKFLLSGANNKEFVKINKELQTLSQDLQLGIAIQQLFDENQDRIDHGNY